MFCQRMMNSRQRQFLQHLRSQEWVKAILLPHSPTVTAKVIENGWVEKRDTGGDLSYRLTDAGLAAMKTPV